MSASSRRREVIIAGHKGVETTITAAFGDPDATVRASAFGALHRMGRLTGAQVRQAAADPDPTVRRRCANLMATTPGLAIDEVLSALLSDDDATVVEVACWTCGERPLFEATFAQLITIAADHEDPLCRESAIAALGALGDDRALPSILTGCSDKPAVRRRSVLALAPFDGDEVQAALTKALEDRDWQVRQAAEDLI